MTDTLVNILHSALTPMQRLVLLDVALTGKRNTDSRHYVLDESASLKAIAMRLHISERSVSDAMHALVNAGVLTWERSCAPEGAMNRYGERIPVNKASRANGDFIAWQHASIVSLPVDVALPAAAPRPANVERARVRAASERQRVRQMQDELQALLCERDCPTCGTHASLKADVRAHCETCGEIFDADALDKILNTPAQPAAPERSVNDDLTYLQTLQDSACTHAAKFSDERDMDALKEKTESLGHLELDAPANFACEPAAPHDCDADELTQVPEELTGADNIAFLASLGVDAFSRQRVIGDKKAGYDSKWLDNPIGERLAIEHLLRSTSHLVGILPEHGDIIMLDIDAGLSEFLALHPGARSWCRVIRSNAPERAKFVIRLKGDKARNLVRETGDKLRKVELISSRRAGVIAGLHPSGAQYTLVTGEIPELDVAQTLALIDAFIPALVAPAPANFAGASSSGSSGSSGSAAKRAIAYWLAQPANVAQALALIERRPRNGKHFSLRDNDSTPSCMLTSADAVHDYGTGAHYDLFDVWCLLTNTNKRSAIHDAYQAMRKATR